MPLDAKHRRHPSPDTGSAKLPRRLRATAWLALACCICALMPPSPAIAAKPERRPAATAPAVATPPSAEIAPAAAAPVQPVAAPVPPAAAAAAEKAPTAPTGGVTRSITLTELGFATGMEFGSFGGKHDFFFPVPAQGVKSAVLRVKFRAGAAVVGRRHLLIATAGTWISSNPLGADETGRTIDIPIDPSAAKDGFVTVTFRYSGAFTQDRCVDQRVAGDFLNILPETALEMQLAPEALTEVAAVASLMPHDVTVVLPNRVLKASETTTALHVISAMKRNGATVSVESRVPPQSDGIWRRGIVMIGLPHDFAEWVPSVNAANGVTIVNMPAGPALLVGGADPSPAIALLNSSWRPLASGPSLTVLQADTADAPRDTITLADLGVGLQSADLVDQVRFDAIFSTDRLPAGHRVSAIRAEVALSEAPNSANASISVFLNGRLLGSRASPGSVPSALNVSVPEGVIGRENILNVRVQRPPFTGDCMNPAQGYPVQLLTSTALKLTPTSSEPDDFFALAPAFKDGVDVFLPSSPAALRDALSLLAMTAADLLPQSALVNVRFDTPKTAPESAYIAVLKEPLAQTAPSMVFDSGRMQLRRTDGKVMLDLSAEDAPTVAQIVHNGTTAGLWIRPGIGRHAALERPIKLDRGNIAVLDRNGIALAFSHGGEQLVSIAYVEVRSWADLAREYRPWIVGALWLALTAVFISILSRYYRRKNG